MGEWPKWLTHSGDTVVDPDALLSPAELRLLRADIAGSAPTRAPDERLLEGAHAKLIAAQDRAGRRWVLLGALDQLLDDREAELRALFPGNAVALGVVREQVEIERRESRRHVEAFLDRGGDEAFERTRADMLRYSARANRAPRAHLRDVSLDPDADLLAALLCVADERPRDPLWSNARERRKRCALAHRILRSGDSATPPDTLRWATRVHLSDVAALADGKKRERGGNPGKRGMKLEGRLDAILSRSKMPDAKQLDHVHELAQLALDRKLDRALLADRLRTRRSRAPKPPKTQKKHKRNASRGDGKQPATR